MEGAARDVSPCMDPQDGNGDGGGGEGGVRCRIINKTVTAFVMSAVAVPAAVAAETAAARSRLLVYRTYVHRRLNDVIFYR